LKEDALISLAIQRTARARYRNLLANPKKRRRLLDKLNHSPPLDERYTTWFSSFTAALAHADVAPATRVYLLSASDALDGKEMTLGQAVVEVPTQGWGTIIGVSEHLALYYGELGERAAVIVRTQ